MTKCPRLLDPTVLSDEAQKLSDRLLRKVIGQDRAVRQFVKVVQQLEVGLNKPNRPAGVFLFLGPTGVGKTELVRATAEAMLGSKEAITRVDCGEFQAEHEVAKLIGAPPGYVGHGNSKTVRFSQEKIDAFQTKSCKMNFILLDEIEEAHDTFFSAILQIMDAGRLTLGNGEETDFSKTIVIMTSNLGERETQTALMGKGLGFKPTTIERGVMDDKIYKVSKAAAEKKFKAKFMNRIDRLIVFRSLSQESLDRILHIELEDLEFRVWGTATKLWERSGRLGQIQQFRVIFKTTKAADAFLLKEGTSQKYGARELNRAIVRFVEFPLGALIGSKQIVHGDVLEIDHKEGAEDLTFSVVAHRDLPQPPPLKYDATPPVDILKDLPPAPDGNPKPKPKMIPGAPSVAQALQPEVDDPDGPDMLKVRYPRRPWSYSERWRTLANH